jgi:hypothetical protein
MNLSFLFSASWEQLRSQNILSQGLRFANSTKNNVLSHIRQWLYFTIYFGLDMLPASPESLCLFMELMSNTSSYGHCKNVLSSVKYIHTATGHKFPADNFGLEATLQGIKRRLKGTPQFVLPIDPVILRRMYSNIDITNTQDLSLWCSFLTAFYCLFRKANTVPKDHNFDPDCVLTRGDIVIDEAGQNVLIYVNFSKVNQYQKIFHVIPIPANSDPALDLYRHIKKLFSLVRATRTSPAFMYSARHFITYRSFTHRLKQLLAKSGLDPALYSGHSFRRGGASYLYGIGGSTLMVQVLGDWASQIFTRYLYLSVDDRKAAQELIRININSSVGMMTLPTT